MNALAIATLVLTLGLMAAFIGAAVVAVALGYRP